MKKLFNFIREFGTLSFLFCFLISAPRAESQTTVGGLISTNTTWTYSGSPYIVNENILVDEGVTLTIEPHVVVKFDSANALLVRGTLRAIGGADNYITFTSNQVSPQPGDWGYISFDNESTPYDTVSGTGCIMDYCIIEYAGNYYGYAVGCSESFPKISHSYLRNNNGSALQIYHDNQAGIQLITYNVFENNSLISIGYNGWYTSCIYYIGYNSYNIFAHNIIRNNGWQSQYFYSIFRFEGEGLNFSDNIFTENFGLPLAQIQASQASIIRNLFCGNSSGGYDEHNGMVQISIGSANGVSNNIIAENRQEYPDEYWGSPILSLGYYGGAAGINFSFTNNSLIRNSTSNSCIAIPSFVGDFIHNTLSQNYSSLDFDNTIVQGGPGAYFNFNYCNTFNNYNNANTLYSYKSSFQPQNNDFNAVNDYWGYSNSNSIDSVIFDYFDDLSTGVVDYSPFLSQPDITAPVSPPLNFIKTDLGGNTVQFTWNANPEADIAGYKIYWDTINCYSFHNVTDVGNVTSVTLTNVDFNDIFAVTAYDNSLDGVNDQLEGNESWFTYDQQNSVAVNVPQVENSTVSAMVYPNPMSKTSLLLTKNIQTPFIVELYDDLGNLVRSEISSQKVCEIHKASLVPGLYLFLIKKDVTIKASGKLVVQ